VDWRVIAMEQSKELVKSHFNRLPRRISAFRSLVAGVAALSLLAAAEAPAPEEAPILENADIQPTESEVENLIETPEAETPEIDAPVETEILPYAFNVLQDCVTEDTWEFTINASYDSNHSDDSGLQSTIAPHGGPDTDSPEYNPDVVYELNLAPGESKSVTVTDLPEIARYEWIDTTENQLITEFNGGNVDFSRCEIVPAPTPETSDETPDQPIEAPEEPTPEPKPKETPAETDTTVEEEVEASTPVESANPQEELPATGINALFLAIGGSAMIATGGSFLRRKKAQ